MSPSPSPLARPADDLLGVPRQVWVIASILALFMAAAYLGYLVWERGRDLQDARAQLKDVKAQLEKAKIDAIKLESDWKEKLALTDEQLETLRKDKEASIASHKSLEDEMRAALDSRDVTISQLQGKLTVNILDRVMFESGEAVLQPDGEAVLLKVAAVFKQHPTLMLHVVGHTDNVPIRLGARARFASNWELSTARALAAVRFLTEKGGVDPRRLGAVGYGEFRPIADNSTPQGRARNRRIAITVVSDEIVGSDAAASATMPAAEKTNAAPASAAAPTNSAIPSAIPPSIPAPEPPPATPSNAQPAPAE
jgi:chemotaxis protein MotB